MRTAAFLEAGSVNGTRARAIVVDRPVVSIDTEADFAAAEALMRAREGDARDGDD